MNVAKLKPEIEYWPNGNKKRHLFVDSENNLHGEFKSWHKNGQLYVHCFCENDNFHGEYKSWHVNGQLYVHCFCENDKRHGEYKTWYKNGQLGVDCFYENGHLHGEFKRWYENGQLNVHCFYENNIELDIPKKDLPKTKDEYVLFCLKYGNLPLLGASE